MSKVNFESFQQKKNQNISNPELSICIRVYNEVNFLPQLIHTLQKQTLQNFELNILDSGSNDGTEAYILENVDCNLYTIDKQEFKFGETCNLLAEISTSPYICFLSGHVDLPQNDALETVLNYLANNGVDIGYFRQVPNYYVGCSPYDEVFLNFKYPGYKGVEIQKGVDSAFSNAGSMFKKTLWSNKKFPDVVASEDYLWVKDFDRVAYFSDVVLMHSHSETFEQITKRVNLNKVALIGFKRSYLKFFIKYMQIFLLLSLKVKNIKTSHKYAMSHAKGYL